MNVVFTCFPSGSALTGEERSALERRFPRDDWRFDVFQGDTIVGYAEWIERQIAHHFYNEAPYFLVDSQGTAAFLGDRVSIARADGERFTGRVHAFAKNSDDVIFVEVVDQYKELFDCLPSEISIREDDPYVVGFGVGNACRVRADDRTLLAGHREEIHLEETSAGRVSAL
jgi:hypothetical protein